MSNTDLKKRPWENKVLFGIHVMLNHTQGWRFGDGTSLFLFIVTAPPLHPSNHRKFGLPEVPTRPSSSRRSIRCWRSSTGCPVETMTAAQPRTWARWQIKGSNCCLSPDFYSNQVVLVLFAYACSRTDSFFQLNSTSFSLFYLFFLSVLPQQLHSSVRTGNLETCLRLLSLGAQANFFHPVKTPFAPIQAQADHARHGTGQDGVGDGFWADI